MKEASPCRVPRHRSSVLLAACAACLPLLAAGVPESPEPPVTRAAVVVDDVHGVEIADPYRWLEDGSSEEVRRWVESESAYTRGLLDARPGRDAARKRLAKLLSIGTLTAPSPRGGHYFYTRREGEQNQPILYVRDSAKGKDRPLVDPNALSPDGTAAIDWWYPSEDGSLLAYGVSTSGDEKSTLRVLDVATGRPLPDVIPHTRYCTLGWLPDKSGFYYTRYPAPGEVPAGQENYNRHIFFHRLGSDWTHDPKIYGEKRKPEDLIEFTVSPDGRFMVVWALEGWSRSDLYVKDLKSEGSPFVPVAEGIDAIFQGEVIGDTLYLMSNWEAPRYRLFAVDPKKPERAAWKILIPQSDAVLSEAHYVGGQLVALYLKDAASRLSVFSAAGKKIRDIPLPALGTVEKVDGRHDGREAFFGFSSYTLPPSVYRYDLKSGAVTLWDRVESDLDLGVMEVKQVFYRSKDGTRVPMFLVHRKGLRLDGGNPTVLYGYGGFNISLTPAFSRSVVHWLERGGVYAVANLRGGGEYGEDWHRAGMLERKQNVFDDFIAAAEWLIAQKYTSPKHLAIYGGSNGGLLVGAALTQRPDLFRAVVCAVPLLDMVRYHNFQIARLWVPEYGSAENADQFRVLYAYSPYHKVKDGAPYPAVLVETAESDSRVDPMHARKMTARLQKATSSKLPILLRTETKAGHGAGKPLAKVIDEATDTWTFLTWQLGLEPAAPPATGR
jgi:prolyl oligopeptidase